MTRGNRLFFEQQKNEGAVSPMVIPPELPEELKTLKDLALDLRWMWSHHSDALWGKIAPETWEKTRNPWVILQDVPRERLERLSKDTAFRRELENLAAERRRYLQSPYRFAPPRPGAGAPKVAYFSMEFGLDEALPLYAGGLGILAGDYLKTASDMGLPLVGVGLLYQEGYCRQVVDADGRQREICPYNYPGSLPIQQVRARSGSWENVTMDLPGRRVWLRIWKAIVGRVSLYLLDTNDPRNTPTDRGITGKLYGGGLEMRLLQEMVLGVGGWRALAAMGLRVDVCHLNEGHAAFVVLERACACMKENQLDFRDALWATRAGNVFTTHTPVPAGFDAFPAPLIQKYFADPRGFLAESGVPLAELLSLGRLDPLNPNEPFNMAYLAMRGCAWANGVSHLHGEVSRRLFRVLYPHWPEAEVPVGHVTNGVHVPSWDSAWSDRLWTDSCGKGRWRGEGKIPGKAIQALSDADLWALRTRERQDLVHHARRRLERHLGERGADPEAVARAGRVLDADVLTLGFARRFAEYKRPNLLLRDPERFVRLLTNPDRPVQIVVAGKAHPEDEEGKRQLRDWVAFVNRPQVRDHAVFLEDYDISLAQVLVQGVDVWINTPRRPMEACGTSGMKVLVNGGLNLSETDGWWAEAYAPDVGWALSTAGEPSGPDRDNRDADRLYRLLETEVVPQFYDRDARGIPRAWTKRIRASMSRLVTRFSGVRMLGQYVKELYYPAAAALRRRATDGFAGARGLREWEDRLTQFWRTLRLGSLDVRHGGKGLIFDLSVFLGDLSPLDVQVEIYADATDGEETVRAIMEPASPISGSANGFIYQARFGTKRPAEHFTPRIIPNHPQARIPMEAAFILWLK